MNLAVIRNKLDDTGKTHKEIAEELGIHPTTLSRFLNGKTELGLESLAKLLKLLNVKFEALIKKAS